MTTNWGRWGEKDERGAINLITPEVTLRAAQCIRTGRAIPLGYILTKTGTPVYEGRQSHLHFMTIDGGDFAVKSANAEGVEYADDWVGMNTHHGTHIDALAHVWANGQLYNGFSREMVRSTGARACDISKVGAVVTRGVLLDVAKHKGVPHLEDGYVITAADLDSCAKAQGVTVESGDAVMIRTGWLSIFKHDPSRFERSQPGIGMDGARYLSTCDISMVGSDNLTLERFPYEGHEEGGLMRAHVHLLRDHGIYLVEMVQLDELAATGRYDFMFTLAPLRIRGAVGSPVNPIAII